MTPAEAIVCSLCLCICGAIACLIMPARRRLIGWVAAAFTGVSSAFALIGAGKALHLGVTKPETFLRIKDLFALTVHIDGLSAFFILLIASLALPVVLYSVEYMEMYPPKKVRGYYFWFLIFIAALYGLVSTTDMMWFFFIFWQMMTIPGFFLIRFEKERAENRKAAFKFLIMMEIACLLTMIGAELVAGYGQYPIPSSEFVPGLKYDFANVSKRLPLLLRDHPGIVTLAFLCFLCGFGIKLGMWPFGRVWLPDAHPAAPSPMSAMLSGVMLKTGVYGIMRYFLWLVPLEQRASYPALEWGVVMSLLGTITLLTGTVGALKQHLTKRLLAFHSIGQLGYILFSIGVAMVLLGAGKPELDSIAVVAFAGALLHTLHHATFKGLLFLNAGSVLKQFGTQDLNRLGGLLKSMKWTGLTCAIASLSISGVPGLNGFVSKWAIYIAGVEGHVVASWLPVCTLVALLTGTLTLASFLKFYCSIFLGRGPDPKLSCGTNRGGRIGVLMQTAEGLLALICFLAGVLPAITFGLVRVSLEANHLGLGAVFGTIKPTTPAVLAGVRVVGNGVIVGLLVVGLLVLGGLFSFALSKAGGSNRRRDDLWLCGAEPYHEGTRFRAKHFYRELRLKE